MSEFPKTFEALITDIKDDKAHITIVDKNEFAGYQDASEIVGYCHPVEDIRKWWFDFYCRIVNDAHLNIETKKQMMKRLSDNERN